MSFHFFLKGNYCIRSYGYEDPKYNRQKYLPMKEIIEAAPNGKYLFEDKIISVRTVPQKFSKMLRGATHIVGEDLEQLNLTKDSKNEISETPIVFVCPQCAGNLKVDGKNRIIHCEYCNSDIFIPDKLWLRFHPTKIVSRWYLWYGFYELTEGKL